MIRVEEMVAAVRIIIASLLSLTVSDSFVEFWFRVGEKD